MPIELFYQKYPHISQRDLRLLYDFFSYPSNKQDLLMDKAVHMIEHGVPLQRILGEWEFWGLPFYLSPETLVPRPDTETLIEASLKYAKNYQPQTILDLGTGSGCILISLLHEFSQAEGLGIDISRDALKTAQKNAVRNNVHHRAHFVSSNWFDGLGGGFDLIVSNPPYIRTTEIESLRPEVKQHDPYIALDGGTDGLDHYKIILANLKKFLSPHGLALFEIGYDQESEVRDLINKSDLCMVGVHHDLNKNPRVVSCSAYYSDGDKSFFFSESLD